MRFNVPLRAPPRPPLISQIKEKHFPTRSVGMIKNQFNKKRFQDVIKAEHASEANTAVTTHNSTQLRTHISQKQNFQ